MSTDDQRRATDQDLINAHEAMLTLAIGLRDKAMADRNQHPEKSPEWNRLNDLVTEMDTQALKAQEYLRQALSRIAGYDR